MARPKNVTISLSPKQRAQLQKLTGEVHTEVRFESVELDRLETHLGVHLAGQLLELRTLLRAQTDRDVLRSSHWNSSSICPDESGRCLRRDQQPSCQLGCGRSRRIPGFGARAGREIHSGSSF